MTYEELYNLIGNMDQQDLGETIYIDAYTKLDRNNLLIQAFSDSSSTPIMCHAFPEWNNTK